jgi:zinc finger protein CreA/MIG
MKQPITEFGKSYGKPFQSLASQPQNKLTQSTSLTNLPSLNFEYLGPGSGHIQLPSLDERHIKSEYSSANNTPYSSSPSSPTLHHMQPPKSYPGSGNSSAPGSDNFFRVPHSSFGRSTMFDMNALATAASRELEREKNSYSSSNSPSLSAAAFHGVNSSVIQSSSSPSLTSYFSQGLARENGAPHLHHYHNHHHHHHPFPGLQRITPLTSLYKSRHDDDDEPYLQHRSKKSRPNSPSSTAPNSPTFSPSNSPTPDHTPLVTPAHSPRLHPRDDMGGLQLPSIRSLSLGRHVPPLQTMEVSGSPVTPAATVVGVTPTAVPTRRPDPVSVSTSPVASSYIQTSTSNHANNNAAGAPVARVAVSDLINGPDA